MGQVWTSRSRSLSLGPGLEARERDQRFGELTLVRVANVTALNLFCTRTAATSTVNFDGDFVIATGCGT